MSKSRRTSDLVNSLLVNADNSVNIHEGTQSPYFQLDTAANPTLQPGMFGWNDADGTANLRLKGNNVTLQLGQETLVRVVNKTGADLLESQYKAVRIRLASEGGAAGQRLAVVLAKGDADLDSVTTLGIVTETIANNQEGFVTVFGNVNEINTTGSLQGETWVDGDVLYLSPTTAGSLTKVKPTAPNHTVTMGYVVYAHAVHGKIFVKVDNGYELEELHDVAPTPYVNKGVLYRDTATNLWKSATVETLLGGTPLLTVPTLAQVTTAGNTTTNAITVGGLKVIDTANVGVQITNGNATGSGGRGTLIIGESTANGRLQITVDTSIDTANFNYTYAGLISFSTGSVERMRIARTTGNLLINTTTDAGYKLDVNGTVRVSGSNLDIINSAATFKIGRNTSIYTTFEAQNDGAVRVAVNGVTKFYIGANVLSGLEIPSSYSIAFVNPGIAFYGHINWNTSTNQFEFKNADKSAFSDIGIRKLTTIGSITASAALAQGVYFNNTLVAAANNDVLVGLDINPTFTNGAFTGVSNVALRIKQSANAELRLDSNNSTINYTGGSLFLSSNGTTRIRVNAAGGTIVLNQDGGNLLVGTTTDAGYKLDVNGTGAFRNTLTVFYENEFRQDGISSHITSRYGIFFLRGWSTGTQTAYFNGWNQESYINTPLNIGSSSTTMASMLSVYGSRTASAALAQGVYFNNTLVAAANNDVLVGLDINPTFTNGAFTGVSNVALRIKQSANAELRLDSNNSTINYTGGSLFLSSNGTTRIRVNAAGGTIVLNQDGGNLLVGTTTDAGYKLDVNGTVRISGTTYFGNTNNQIQLDKRGGTTSSSYLTLLQDGNNRTFTFYQRASVFGATVDVGMEIGAGFLTLPYYQALIGASTTTSNAKLIVTGSITASAALAQGVYFNNTLVAAANNDVLVGLDINPTFTNGAFTGVTNYAVRITGRQLLKATVDGFESIKLQNFADTYFNTISFYKSNGTSQTVVLGDNGASVAYPFMTGMLANYGFVGNKNSGFHIFAGSNIAQTIHTNGNIGINTATDAGYKLDVNGTGIFRGNLEINAGTNGQIFINNAYPRLIFGKTGTPSWSMYADTENAGQFEMGRGAGYPYNSFVRFLWVSTSDKIAIGGASGPTAKILLSGSVTATSALGVGTSVTQTITAAANNDVLVGLDITPTYTKGAFTGVSGYGVRITSPTTTDVALRINATEGIYIYNAATATRLTFNGNYGQIINATGLMYIDQQANYDLILRTNTTERVRVFADGNVGINVAGSNTGYKLNVNGNIALSGNLVPTSGTSSVGTFTNRFTDFWGSGLIVGTTFYGDNLQSASGTLYFKEGGGIEKMRMTSGGNFLIGTTTDTGQKLQISGSIFIKGTTSLTATKIFEVQNGSGTSIMDFRDNQYAFFGCGQGGGSASGFIFNYSNTSYTQFSGYNYGAGAGSYKPILMDTDGGGRNQGIFVNFGVTTNTPPSSDTEFAVRGRTSNSSTYISKFVDSSNVERFSIRADGALFTDGNIGYTGTVNFPTNPPGQQNIDIVNGMIVNVF